MLTTFNEVDMTEVISMRNQYKEEFQNNYGVKLGFIIFVKACVLVLKIILQSMLKFKVKKSCTSYYNISIAVGTDRGLVVPGQETDEMSFADIEKNIGLLSQKANSK